MDSDHHPPSSRPDGRVIRVFGSLQGAVRVSVEEPPATGNLITREAFYTREEVEQIAGNIHDGGRIIKAAWMSAGEEYFADETRKPFDGIIPED